MTEKATGRVKEDIDAAIHKFYDWLARNIEQGKMKMGSRLRREQAMVSKSGIVTDGPFNEGKEVIGGYWFIVARSLQEAAELAARNPCAQYGLSFEIRPLEAERASAYKWRTKRPRLAEESTSMCLVPPREGSLRS